MRMLLAAAVLALPGLALAQEQQEAALPAPPAASGNQPVFDIVAADRETAWRINRVTGEITVCRIDTASGLDTVRARCSAASVQNDPQTSATGGAKP